MSMKMKAGILAAGDGARMAAGGLATPKPLLRVGGVSLIERTMRALIDAGIDELHFIVNERMTSVIDVVAGLRLDVPVHAIVETTPSSMHSLKALAPRLGPGRFVLCTVDSILRARDVHDFVRQFSGRPATDVLLSYTDFVDDENPLRIAVAEDGRVTHLGAEAADSPHVTLGLYGMTPDVLPILDRAVADGTERLRNFLGRLLSDGVAIYGHQIDKGIDVDRPRDLVAAEAFVSEEERE